MLLCLQILYDSHPRSRSVSESASSDTTAPASSDTTVPASSDVTVPAGDSTSDTPSGTGDNEAASQEQEEIEGVVACCCR